MFERVAEVRSSERLCFFCLPGCLLVFWDRKPQHLPCFGGVALKRYMHWLPHARHICAARPKSGTARTSSSPSPHRLAALRLLPNAASSCEHLLSVSSAPGMRRLIQTARRRLAPPTTRRERQDAVWASFEIAGLGGYHAKSTQRMSPTPTSDPPASLEIGRWPNLPCFACHATRSASGKRKQKGIRPRQLTTACLRVLLRRLALAVHAPACHTATRVLALAHAHTRAHACSNTCTRTRSRMHTDTPTTERDTDTQTHPHPHPHPDTHTHTPHTRALARVCRLLVPDNLRAVCLRCRF